ncbi:unnamed protein product [Calicophoron daubneyi]|uniref:Uncharacterized protein n=1 Tax=Calicophoron daubneyi TaxID=300641 RepID=A0AAV2TKU9_CALDB
MPLIELNIPSSKPGPPYELYSWNVNGGLNDVTYDKLVKKLQEILQTSSAKLTFSWFDGIDFRVISNNVQLQDAAKKMLSDENLGRRIRINVYVSGEHSSVANTDGTAKCPLPSESAPLSDDWVILPRNRYESGDTDVRGKPTDVLGVDQNTGGTDHFGSKHTPQWCHPPPPPQCPSAAFPFPADYPDPPTYEEIFGPSFPSPSVVPGRTNQSENNRLTEQRQPADNLRRRPTQESPRICCDSRSLAVLQRLRALGYTQDDSYLIAHIKFLKGDLKKITRVLGSCKNSEQP